MSRIEVSDPETSLPEFFPVPQKFLKCSQDKSSLTVFQVMLLMLMKNNQFSLQEYFE